jgi:hypothetical protein
VTINNYMGKITIKCKNCDEEFVDYECRKRSFCSHECKKKSQERKVTLKCDNCKEDFSVIPSKSKWRIYCSPKCSSESQSLSEEHKLNVIREYNIEYNKRDYVKVKRKEYNKRDYVKAREKEYIKNNRERINKRNRDRYQNDPDYKHTILLRTFLANHLKRNNEQKVSWFDHVGCTKEEFTHHIESQFTEGMTWDNWNIHGWHMDHITPLSKGGTNHYTNLQPLWAADNLVKGDKLI